MGLTPNYVGHIFKDVQKVSISRYILDIRMKKVEYYLHHSNLSIPKIIDNIGMEHSSYFYTCFKKYFGMSLSEYRNKILNKDDTNESQL